MTSNPFRDLSETNPYASPSPAFGAQPTGNPLLAPALVLLILSSLSLLLAIASFPGQVERIRALDESTSTSIVFGYLASITVIPLSQIAMAIGSISMIRLKGYRSAYLSAIFSVIPLCSPCLLLGIPFGIWSLVLLHRPEVKQRFLV